MFGRFVPGHPKLLGGPCVGGSIGNRALSKIKGKIGYKCYPSNVVSVSTKR